MSNETDAELPYQHKPSERGKAKHPRTNSNMAGVNRADGAADPDSGMANTLRILRDDPAFAAQQLEARIQGGTADFRTWHNLAVARAKTGELAGAQAACKEALRLEPKSVRSHFLHAKILQESDQYSTALRAYQDVANLDPDFPNLHASRGISQFFLGKLEASIEDLKIAFQKAPEDKRVLFNLAVVQLAAKSFGSARRCVERLIEMDPKGISFYSQFLVELGSAQMVEESLSQAHRIKNFVGIVGDRFRRNLGQLESELSLDFLAPLGEIQTDIQKIYGDMVVFLRAIRPRPLRFERVDLRRLLERVVFVSIDKGDGIRIQRDYEDPMPLVRCDMEMLQEAFLNLLLNALESVRDLEESRKEVCIKTQSFAAGIRVSFCDQGDGIDSEVLDKIFDFGFTTKNMGTGVGLAFTQKIMQDHGGRIEVESEVGVGSSFHCYIPSQPQEGEAAISRRLKTQLFADPQELIIEETGGELGI